MIYSHTEEIILLYTSDGRATLHESNTMKGTPTTEEILNRWRKWFEILNDSENTPSLKTAIEQAEFLYDLCRKSR